MALEIQKFQKAVRVGREQLADVILPRHAWIRTQMGKISGEDMLCDACGKNMTMPDGGMSVIGMQIRMGTDEKMDVLSRQWLVEQMAPFAVNREYNVCFPCLLHSLGVRPAHPVENPVPDDPLIVY